jgi:zinc transporter
MQSEFGLLHGYQITPSGEGIPLNPQDASRSLKDKFLTWLHFDANHPGSREFVEREMAHLDHIILSALFADETRPRILEYDKGTLLILRGINLNENAEPEDMISIRVWVEQTRIITVRRRRLKVVQDMVERLTTSKGPKSSGEFISMLTARLFERMEPIFTELDDRLDLIEERVIELPDTSERKEISDIRKEAILYRRYIAPQRDVMAHLRTSEQPWLDLMNKRKLQETMDHVIRYIEDLDTIRERAQIVKDELVNALSDRMNKNLYMLSVIAAIFLPLGFLTGLLGINLGGIPGAENGHAFYIFCGFLFATVTCQLLLFKKLKWF